MPFFSRDSRLKAFLKKVNSPQHSEVDRWQSYESVEDEYPENDAENTRRLKKEKEEEEEENDRKDLDYQHYVKGGNKEKKIVNMYLTDLIFFYEDGDTTIAEYKKILTECNKNCDYYKEAIRIINYRFDYDKKYKDEKWFRDGYKDDYKRWDHFKTNTDIINFYSELGKIQKDSNEESALTLEEKKPEEQEATAAGGNRSHKKRKHKRTHKKRKNKRTRITRKNKRQRKTRRKI
jgi:hypothetical protein